MKAVLHWRGDQVLEDMRRAERVALEQTADASVERAGADHPSWTDRTGETARSITVLERTMREGQRTAVRIGSRLAHFFFLEIGHHGRRGDRTISRATRVEGARLPERIRQALPAEYRR